MWLEQQMMQAESKAAALCCERARGLMRFSGFMISHVDGSDYAELLRVQ